MDNHQSRAIGADGDVAGSDNRERSFTARVALNGVDFRPIALEDPLPTGRQILAVAKLRPTEDHQLYAVTESGDFEDVRLDETFDLRSKGVERFIAFSGDRAFRFTIEDREIRWGLAKIDEATLRYLGNVAEENGIFLEVRGGTDCLIEEDETVGDVVAQAWSDVGITPEA